MTTFLHCADLHLDSPLKGLSAYAGAPVDTIRGATRGALEALVELALDEQVAAVIIAGDVYDGDWKDFSSGLYFRAQMGRLREAGIEVVLIHGNHDATSVVTRRLALPGVHVLSSARPETVILEEAGLAIHGQSFATRSVTANLAAGYPAPLPGFVNVGVLHTSLSSEPGDNYAPCSLAELVAHGYDYWALGHVHDREVLHERPHVVFSGNLQGRHMRETGPKGATLVTVGDDGLSVSERVLDVVRWARVRVDLGGIGDETELVERAEAALRDALAEADGRLLAARLVLTGMTSAFAALVRDRERLEVELRGLATDIGFEQVWLERIAWEITPPRSAGGVGDDSLGVALGVLRGARSDESALTALAEALRPLALKLPPELRNGEDGLDPTDPEVLRRLLAGAQEMLPGYLLERAA